MNKTKLLKLINFYPPYLGAGVKVKSISPDFTEVFVQMKLRFWNKNYVGTHFGGSLYSMVDPFFMLMLIQILGRDYIVWDKAASIRFKRPGKGTVFATFKISPEDIDVITKTLETEAKYDHKFLVNVVDEGENIISEIEKILHISKKKSNL